MKQLDHVYVIAGVFTLTLIAYCTLSILGADGQSTLADLLWLLAGGVGVAIVPKARS